MWPFSEMGYSAAVWWSDVANVVLLISLVAGVISTFVIVQSGNVKEAQWSKDRTEAAERIASLTTRSNELRNETAVARKEAAEAQLALEKYKAPRKIDGPAFLAALQGKPKAPVEIVFVRDDPECWQLAMQIRDWLKAADWEYMQPAAITGPDEARFLSYPSAMQAGGQPRGVTVVQLATSQADFMRERMESFDDPLDTPAKALSHALMQSLGTIAGSMSFETGTPGKLRVVVGPKP